MAERHNGGYGQDYPEEYRGRHDDEQRERSRSGGRFRDEDEYTPHSVRGQSREDFGDMEHGRSRRFGGGTAGGQQRDPRDYEREQDYRWSGGGRSFEEPHRLVGRQGGREQQWGRDLPRDPSQAGRRSGGSERGGFGEYEGRPYQSGYERGGSRFEPQGGGVGGFGRLGSFGDRQETAWGGGWESGEQGLPQGRHAGRGPRGYQRSDDRIREDVCDALTADPFIDATEITITVHSGDVTLEGTVDDRQAKRRAEDCVEDLPGVRQVHNRLTVQSSSGQPAQPAGSAVKSGTTSGKGTQT
jgi:hypothetical protein